MSQTNYNQVVTEIKALDLSDQLRLLQDMVAIIRTKTNASEPRSILELRGKGKEIWKDINIQEYIDQERTSWNG